MRATTTLTILALTLGAFLGSPAAADTTTVVPRTALTTFAPPQGFAFAPDESPSLSQWIPGRLSEPHRPWGERLVWDIVGNIAWHIHARQHGYRPYLRPVFKEPASRAMDRFTGEWYIGNVQVVPPPRHLSE